MCAVEFQLVSHSYSNTTVLHNVNFKIDRDLITVILGKSGSGKSTLLQMINGLIIPTRGTVYHFGMPIDYKRLTELRLNIGYSVQGTGLFPHMSVFENIALPVKISGKKPGDVIERIEQLMEFVNLDHAYLKKYPHQLSGGEQQRVGICRAMVLNPGLFILDEAFGALDLSTRNEIHEELKKLQHAEPRTIIMVTHDVHEAFKLAQKILILDSGHIVQYDTKDNIINNPANELVSAFISQVKNDSPHEK
jgi:osmoprotectant transport system ATP-binding protein